jgi:hypothetical protein
MALDTAQLRVIMLSISNKPIILSVIRLSVVLLSVVLLSVVLLSVVMLTVMASLKFTHSFCKVRHFRAPEKIVNTN